MLLGRSGSHRRLPGIKSFRTQVHSRSQEWIVFLEESLVHRTGVDA